MDIAFKILSALGTILGGWALIRSYWLTRSKLAIVQKAEPGHNRYDRTLWMPELLISNLSGQGNSIVRWRAWLKDNDNSLSEIRVAPGKVTDSKTGEVDYLFNATPVNVAPHATTSCILGLFDITKPHSAAPLELKIEAKDMYGKCYSCWCKTDVGKT